MLVQFFYQYLVDGLGTTQALQRATRSLRYFRKYSHYAHGGAYQLCGKDMMIRDINRKTEDIHEQRLGPKVAFQRHDIIKQLELPLLNCSTALSDV